MSVLYRQRGVTLLLTLMVLVILAVVIVQFQADATLQIRAGSYRLERQKCRYAAESAFVVAAVLIERHLREPAQTLPQASVAGETMVENLPDAELSDKYFEPEKEMSGKSYFAIVEHDMDIADAAVKIEIHDENAKWPLFWLVRSPYDTLETNTKTRAAFLKYAAAMNISRTDASRVARQAANLGKTLNLPPAPVRIVSSRRTRGLSRLGRRLEYAEKIAQDEARQKVMGAFAIRWREFLEQNPALEAIRQPLESTPGTFGDYVSMWGANYINLNTAPLEVIESVFEPLGLTKRQAEAVVEYRKEKPFTNTSQLNNVRVINPTMCNNIRSLCCVKSRAFSIVVEARYGRACYRLSGGLYANHRNKLQTSAVFTGD